MPDDDLSRTLADGTALATVMTDLEARSERFGAALGAALQSATAGGKGLDQVLSGLARRLSDIALSAGLKPLENLVGNGVESLLSGVATSLSGTVTPFAKGGVVRSPRYFSFAGGTGLMGEAGAEAILPLSRGPDGALGIAAASGAGHAAPQVVFNVNATDAASFRRSEGQVTAMLARSVARGRRGL